MIFSFFRVCFVYEKCIMVVGLVGGGQVELFVGGIVFIELIVVEVVVIIICECFLFMLFWGFFFFIFIGVFFIVGDSKFGDVSKVGIVVF